MSGGEETTVASYPPPLGNGPIVQVPGKENLYFAAGKFKIGMGLVIGRTMTVLKTDDGLVIFNSVRLDEAEEKRLLAMGPIKAVCCICNHHGIDDPYYVNKFGAKYWQGHSASPTGDENTAYPTPKDIKAESCIQEIPVSDAQIIPIEGVDKSKVSEVSIFLPAMKTLLCCDIIQNYEPFQKGEDVGLGLIGPTLCKLLGFKGAMCTPPMYLKAAAQKGSLKVDFERLQALDYDTFVGAHGPPKTSGAKAARQEFLQKKKLI
jgi:hypothetical protein